MSAEQPLCIAFIWHMHQPHYRELMASFYQQGFKEYLTRF